MHLDSAQVASRLSADEQVDEAVPRRGGLQTPEGGSAVMAQQGSFTDREQRRDLTAQLDGRQMPDRVHAGVQAKDHLSPDQPGDHPRADPGREELAAGDPTALDFGDRGDLLIAFTRNGNFCPISEHADAVHWIAAARR